jgi:hypothetical protein
LWYGRKVFGGLEGLLLVEQIENVLGNIAIVGFFGDWNWSSCTAGHFCVVYRKIENVEGEGAAVSLQSTMTLSPIRNEGRKMRGA